MRKLFIATTILITLGLVFGGYWFWSAERLRTGLQDWREARSAEGYRIEHGEPVLLREGKGDVETLELF